MPSARSAAIGGPHVAFNDDIASLFSNPAGFRAAGPQLSVAEVTLALSGPVFDIASIAVEAAAEGLEAIVALPAVQSLLGSLYTSLNILGPIAFGYVGNGLGFGFYNTTGVTLTSTGAVPSITASAIETLYVAGGYSFRVPLPLDWNSTLDVGALLKAIVSGQIALSRDLLGLMELFQSASVETLLQQSFSLDVGVGVDVGILYTLNERFSIGLVGRNLFTTVMRNQYTQLQAFLDSETPATQDYDSLLPIDISAGISYTPPLGKLRYVLSDLRLFFDYSDIFDFATHPETARNPVLHAGLGFELVLLEILFVRGGFFHGLFSAGLGLDLTVFNINVSMFGRELSTEPGLRPVYNLILSLEFRPPLSI